MVCHIPNLLALGTLVRLLRFSTLARTFKAQDSGTDMNVLTMQDREMLARYMVLSLEDRKTVCEVVVALAVAAKAKAR